MTLTYIPRGVLNNMRIINYNFLWHGIMDKRGIPLLKWKRLAKEIGGWT
jgi:hypothetical protein